MRTIEMPESPMRLPAPLRFTRPPIVFTEAGERRRVGIEVEFAGVDIAEASRIVARLFGGEPEVIHRFRSVVRSTDLGEWRIELDSKVLTEQRYKDMLSRLGVAPSTTEAFENVVEAVGKRWIPYEIVSPPLDLRDLDRTEALRLALRESHAEGTENSLAYAFGFQLNPEAPSLNAELLTRYLRAFLVLYDWLTTVTDVDVSRRFSWFIRHFPDEYRYKVIDPHYAPTMPALIDDYLEANPTRNRPLDMLPIFAFVDPARVHAAVSSPAIKARPAFHYRLPNCSIDSARWSFALEWNRWVEVERLAEEPERLARASRDVMEDASLRRHDVDWRERARAWGIEAS